MFLHALKNAPCVKQMVDFGFVAMALERVLWSIFSNLRGQQHYERFKFFFYQIKNV
jgi:hypothetical protein